MVASARLFEYYDEPEVASALPSSGPASGGTDVLVSGSGFFRRAPLADHGCAFIAHAGAAPVLVPATLSGCDGALCSAARCRSPALSSALALGEQPFVATLALVFNGQQASAAGVNFTVYPLPQVDSVWPTACPNTGGTIVQLSGRNLAGLGPGRDETRPVSTGRGTRRVQLVREGGGGGPSVISPAASSPTCAARRLSPGAARERGGRQRERSGHFRRPAIHLFSE